VAIDMAPATNPATPATRTAFFVAAAAATPTIKLAVERMPIVGAENCGSQPPNTVHKVMLGVQVNTRHPIPQSPLSPANRKEGSER
jgi:hypothetical protein